MTAATEPKYVVDFPTLGHVIDAWIARHCRVPDGFTRGKPFVTADWQFWIIAKHYEIRADAAYDPDEPPRNQAFVYRRSQVVAPQKTGKGPLTAAIVAAEACGPTQFCGWAKAGDVYRCSDHGCPCSWEYAYEAGEPMGERHPSPLIQLTASNESQVDNIYRPLRGMIALGPLKELLAVREGFIRVLGRGDDPDLDKIEAVTSSANSKLGNPISFAVQDETGVWTEANKLKGVAETQRRGAAGMGGRTMETTNAWDPAANSVAQRTYESKSKDIFKFYEKPPADLSYGNKVERRKIHAHVYAGSWWVNLDSIEAEAAELMEKDKAQAERFFGNRLVATSDSWWDEQQIGDWLAIGIRQDVPPGTRVVLGFDGSQYDDWTALRARALREDGTVYAFTPTFDDGKPTYWDPAEHDGEVPRDEVQAAVEHLFGRYDVVRMYCDPELWQSEIDAWSARFGEKRVVSWPTYRTRPMAAALERLQVDTAQARYTHDGDPMMLTHLRNARRVRRPGGVVIGKPTQHQKIDLVMADALAHEASADVPPPRKRGMVVMR